MGDLVPARGFFRIASRYSSERAPNLTGVIENRLFDLKQTPMEGGDLPQRVSGLAQSHRRPLPVLIHPEEETADGVVGHLKDDHMRRRRLARRMQRRASKRQSKVVESGATLSQYAEHIATMPQLDAARVWIEVVRLQIVDRTHETVVDEVVIEKRGTHRRIQ